MRSTHSDNLSFTGAGMCSRVISTILLILVLSFFSCATPKPVLYKEGRPLSITEYEKIAQREYDNDLFENAIMVYQAIIDNYPTNPKALAWAYYEIAYCYWMLKEYESAELNFRKVLNEFQEPAANTLAGQMLERIESEREKKR
jgi:tetratricopeptide (TPR) repeat protein